MIRFTCEGKEFEFRGEYSIPVIGDYLLNYHGNVIEYMENIVPFVEQYAIVHPVLVIHEFGGIKFVETGEVRTAQPKEWFKYRSEESVHFSNRVTFSTAIILKKYEE